MDNFLTVCTIIACYRWLYHLKQSEVITVKLAREVIGDGYSYGE